MKTPWADNTENENKWYSFFFFLWWQTALRNRALNGIKAPLTFVFNSRKSVIVSGWMTEEGTLTLKSISLCPKQMHCLKLFCTTTHTNNLRFTNSQNEFHESDQIYKLIKFNLLYLLHYYYYYSWAVALSGKVTLVSSDVEDQVTNHNVSLA